MTRQEDPGFAHRAGLITVHCTGATTEAIERSVPTPLADEPMQAEEIDAFSRTRSRRGSRDSP